MPEDGFNSKGVCKYCRDKSDRAIALEIIDPDMESNLSCQQQFVVVDNQFDPNKDDPKISKVS